MGFRVLGLGFGVRDSAEDRGTILVKDEEGGETTGVPGNGLSKGSYVAPLWVCYGFLVNLDDIVYNRTT